MPRAFDVLIAALALAILSPVLLVAAIAIKLSSRGPVVYRQRRVGSGGREFEMWKLRTMVEGSDQGLPRADRRSREGIGR